MTVVILIKLLGLTMMLYLMSCQIPQYTPRPEIHAIESRFPQDYRRVLVPPNPELPKSHNSDLNLLHDFEVTWYNNNGITHITASGGQTMAGRTVGVDPKVIPLGTWIDIHMPDGSTLKRRAEDTGGAVKGRILDVYADRSNAELLKRGRTKGATVRILGGG